eukprot:TRINITY_DN472_c1_g1_i8.p1 TRINITY_DN472_c1_g1~~TRINITY_DN472_c1_g1_i8.p1  ORF type:complete len:2177 (+),score=570.77 TRINITY_DN472_c1_g1_i8:136-6531(+)
MALRVISCIVIFWSAVTATRPTFVVFGRYRGPPDMSCTDGTTVPPFRVDCSTPTTTPSPNVTCPLSEELPMQLSAGSWWVPVSNATTVISITKNTRSSPSRWGTPVARSYGGLPWEVSRPEAPGDTPVALGGCFGSCCQVMLPSVGSKYTYQLEAPVADGSAEMALRQRVERVVAKLLIQGTFGPTAPAIAALVDDVLAQPLPAASSPAAVWWPDLSPWVRDQMTMRPSLLRAHMRRRQNVRYRPMTQLPGDGGMIGACDVGARWVPFAITQDDRGRTLRVEPRAIAGGNVTNVLVVGASTVRGELPGNVTDYLERSSDVAAFSMNATYYICIVTERVGQRVQLSAASSCGSRLYFRNPRIEFPNLDPATASGGAVVETMHVAAGDVTWGHLRPDLGWNQEVHIVRQMQTPCTLSTAAQGSGLALLREGTGATAAWYKHDRRRWLTDASFGESDGSGGLWNLSQSTVLGEGTVSPTAATAGVLACPAVPKTFLNAHTCVRTSGCSPTVYRSLPLTLDTATLRRFYLEGGIYVYALTALRLEDTYRTSPCPASTKAVSSRWQRISSTPCASPTSLDAATTRTLTDALVLCDDAVREDGLIRDIEVPAAAAPDCNANSASIGARVDVNGSCWEHVHPHEGNVYDASLWVSAHPGNTATFNPIRSLAEHNLTTLTYPASHSMSRWKSKEGTSFTLLGRLGDEIDFAALPDSVRTPQLGHAFGAAVNTSGEESELCFSPGEVANAPEDGAFYTRPLSTDDEFDDEADYARYITSERTNVHSALAMWAPDQLRQRVAWALSQIYVIGSANGYRPQDGETHMTYYDIFVRHAFGNLRDILQEVSYSPMMGWYLTFRGNRAYASRKAPPDENYAREVMQLFSIGLYVLKDGGAAEVDGSGRPLETYDSDDILTLAKVWTGFTTRGRRGSLAWASAGNLVDPMYIVPTYRDPFPKMDLFDGYLGDGYPLCKDFPARAFLRTGATWRSLGGTPQPLMSDDPGRLYPDVPNITNVTNTSGGGGWLQPSSSSALYASLCRRSGGRCTFPSEVTLTSNLACHGQECLLGFGHPRLVRVVDASTGTVVYYEYLRRPCVSQTYTELRTVYASHENYQYRRRICEDPAEAVGGAACCDDTNTTIFPICPILAERMPYAEAEQRCRDAGMHLCPTPRWNRVREPSDCFINKEFTWIETPCGAQAQVLDDGTVSLLHINGNYVPTHLRVDSTNTFRVRWERRNATDLLYAPGAASTDADGLYPTVANGNCSARFDANGTRRASATSVCEPHGTSCVCDVEMYEEAVYTDTTRVPPAAEVEEMLRIGAPPLEVFDSGTYTEAATAGEVTVYTTAASGGSWDASTIFRVAANHTTGSTQYRWLFNRRAIVRIANSTWTFRNPPTFNDLSLYFDLNRQLTAHHETAALIDHLFWHPNTATFISRLLIQRLGTSNPSPRYVRAVAKAFRTGVYTGYTAEAAQGATAASASAPQYPLTFSGKYGDLGATVAAIVLDPEARMLAVEGDVAFGQMREPLVKVFHLLRAMNYEPTSVLDLNLWSMGSKIGQIVFESPSVFNFYLPDFAPTGAIADSGLVAPEAMLGNEPFTIGFLNGVVSLMTYGLSNRNNGWARSWGPFGRIAYAPALPANATTTEKAEAVVDDLDLLLTGRRMHASTRAVLMDTYNTTFASKGEAKALQAAQKLAGITAEFHTTAPRAPRPAERQQPPQAGQYSHRPYKAVIVLFMSGGCDSWNLLVPHSGCPNNDQLVQEYAATRGTVALAHSAVLPISTTSSTKQQPCSNLGIHPSLPTVKSLYDDGDAVVEANIGSLIEPMTYNDYRYKLKQMPTSLFSHNSQTAQAQSMEPDLTLGVLGGMVKAVSESGTAGYRAAAYSFAGSQRILRGALQVSTVSSGGVTPFRAPELGDAIDAISQNESASVFAETTNNIIDFTLANTGALQTALSSSNISSSSFPSDSLGQQLLQVSRLIKARDLLQAERNVFYVSIGGFDMHSEVVNALTAKFDLIDAAISAFATEMKAQGMWDSVVLQTSSEFARTWFPNGGGTDHGWGGNHFAVGGGLRGKRVHGRFPDSMAQESDVNVGGSKGRILPTSPWETVWAPIAEWFGVDSSRLTTFLPNLPNFNSSIIPSVSEFFTN